MCVLPFEGKTLKFVWRQWIRGKWLSGYTTWLQLHVTHLSSKFVASNPTLARMFVEYLQGAWLNYIPDTVVNIWWYWVVEWWLFNLLVSLPLLMKLVFEMPWCMLWRFMPWNSIMYSMGTLGCFFWITLKLIGLCIPRSIDNLHHQFLALLKGEVVHIYAKNHADCCYLFPFYPFPLLHIYMYWDYLWSSSQPHFGLVAGMPQFPIHPMEIYDWHWLRYVASWFHQSVMPWLWNPTLF